MAISAAMVKQLRDSTGAGMMDAKKALTHTDGDMESAVDWLRTKGLAKAAKKSGRTAAEGLVAVAVDGGKGVVVEVNSETDFVAKNEEFQNMVRSIANAALGVGDLTELKAVKIGENSVESALSEAISRLGENLTLRRMASIAGDVVVSYVHNSAAQDMGTIGVLVALKGTDNGIGRQIAMHVAAANPSSLGEPDLDPDVISRERAFLTEQARESGKPDHVIEKMIAGRMRKFLSEVTLLGQSFVINPDLTVAQATQEAGVEIQGFVRLAVGDGIEKKSEDFAAEVAMVGQQ